MKPKSIKSTKSTKPETKDVEKKVSKTGKVKKEFCQDCSFQKNNPSRCKWKGEFVGRKDNCDSFKRRK